MPKEPNTAAHDIFMARYFAEERSDEINTKIKNCLDSGAFSNHAINIVISKFWEFCENLCKNEVEKKLAYNWVGYSFFTFGVVSCIFGMFWAGSSFIALERESRPVISFWWGLLAVPLWFYGYRLVGAPGETAKRLRERVHEPVSEAYRVLNEEVESPRSAVVSLRNLRSDLDGYSVLSQIYFDMVCDRFTASQAPSADRDSNAPISDSATKTTSSELFKKGFLEAFGAFVFKTIPALTALVVLILVIAFIVAVAFN